jgi:hypothetical protein
MPKTTTILRPLLVFDYSLFAKLSPMFRVAMATTCILYALKYNTS